MVVPTERKKVKTEFYLSRRSFWIGVIIMVAGFFFEREDLLIGFSKIQIAGLVVCLLSCRWRNGILSGRAVEDKNKNEDL